MLPGPHNRWNSGANFPDFSQKPRQEPEKQR